MAIGQKLLHTRRSNHKGNGKRNKGECEKIDATQLLDVADTILTADAIDLLASLNKGVTRIGHRGDRMEHLEEASEESSYQHR
ncbi:hypothetical protein AOT31_10905 [Corynebacterium ulcerans]|nr:hypothetical protein AOT31_10905 [Corynebacterium ulcerans]